MFKSNKALAFRVKNAWAKFDEYYQRTDNSPLYAAALILNPNRRTKYIQTFWKKDWQKSIFPKVRQLWETYLESERPLACLQEVSYGTSSLEESKELDEYDRIVNELNEKVTRPVSQDEYEDYCSEVPYDIKCSPLQWWSQEQQAKRWPQLSLFARNVLSIPAMSDEPERVFSGGRRTISWERMQLGMSNVERLECMKSWYRSKILKENS